MYCEFVLLIFKKYCYNMVLDNQVIFSGLRYNGHAMDAKNINVWQNVIYVISCWIIKWSPLS